jgi:hypothetical protein
MGKEVSTLLDAVQQAGTYRFDFAADGLTSGIYYYRITLSTGGKTRYASGSMMLMK